MKRRACAIVGLSLVWGIGVLGSCLAAQEGGQDGWVPLFEGDSLDGWQFYFGKNGTENNGTFVVRDGVVTCTGQPVGYMYSKKSYSRYTLRLEWAFKLPEGLTDDAKFRGNSGYLIHMGEKNALGVWPRSIEVQGAHNGAGFILPIPRDVRCERTDDREARASVLKPVGQWNAMEIDVNGPDMVIKVNGQVVSTVSNCELTEGPIGFQSEGAEIHWRNVCIREK